MKDFFSRIWAYIKNVVSLTGQIDVLTASEGIKRSISIKGPNTYILAFAIVIASIGLNVNSIPIIIGAMLISPLMGPIIAIGYSLGVNDMPFLKKSAINFLVMVIVSIIASFLYFLLSPAKLENPTELLARTNPTIFDVLVALFGGFAGILEITKKEKGTVFAGVAIATALMPPLCTAGYGIASGEFSYFIGAIYLFFINSVFIALATFISVKYLKFPLTQFADPIKQRRVTRTISLITIIMIIPSIYSAILVIKENNFNQIARDFIKINKTLSKSYIYDYSVNHHSKPPTIEISIAGEALSEGEIELLYRSAENLELSRDQLMIKQNAAMIQDDAADKAVMQSVFERNDMEIKKREELISEMEKEIKLYKEKELPCNQMLKEISAQHPGLESLSIGRGKSINSKTNTEVEEIVAIVKFNRTLDKIEIERLTNWLMIRLNFENVRIVQE